MFPFLVFVSKVSRKFCGQNVRFQISSFEKGWSTNSFESFCQFDEVIPITLLLCFLFLIFFSFFLCLGGVSSEKHRKMTVEKRVSIMCQVEKVVSTTFFRKKEFDHVFFSLCFLFSFQCFCLLFFFCHPWKQENLNLET